MQQLRQTQRDGRRIRGYIRSRVIAMRRSRRVVQDRSQSSIGLRDTFVGRTQQGAVLIQQTRVAVGPGHRIGQSISLGHRNRHACNQNASRRFTENAFYTHERVPSARVCCDHPPKANRYVKVQTPVRAQNRLEPARPR